ncbi:MAG: hypothetical protein J1D77_01325 [Muribaculaceae bacterium]|nr:hypothetical protein [Muribaculaceae bacterium]
MTQIVATLTLDENANPSLIQELLENMKGVIEVTLNKPTHVSDLKKEETEEWISKLHKLQKEIDRSVIDMDDERTRYIMR